MWTWFTMFSRDAVRDSHVSLPMSWTFFSSPSVSAKSAVMVRSGRKDVESTHSSR
jgi:hypothetical protein